MDNGLQQRPYHGVCVYVRDVSQGNYDAYMKTRGELEENQMKRYQWEKDQMQHMKVRALHAHCM